MANFIRIKGGEPAETKRDILINADGVIAVQKNAIVYRMNVMYDTAVSATETMSAEIQFPNTYTVTDSDLEACRLAIEKSCQKPGAIPYFVSSDETMPRYAYASAETKLA